MPQDIILHAVGDVSVRREKPESMFALAGATFKNADIRFGQMENILSERGVPQAHVFPSMCAHPRNVAALTYAGFDVMSAAGNHTLDWGDNALFDTMDLLGKNGIKVIGVGKNIDEARQPAIIEKTGTRVAFLAYCSVLPKGYDARRDKPGAAPMRATTSYEQADWQPGTPPRVLSFANKEDLQAMVDDIKKVRPLVDVVVLSMHWGIHYVPAAIAMYQKEVGYAAIDAGADLILGHHAHILKGIEVYKGKPIFYSLGNFAFDGRSIERVRNDSTWKFYQFELDPDYPTFPFPPDSRKVIIARCIISGGTIQRVSYLPVMVNKQSQPEVLPRSDGRSAEVYDYMERICKDQRLDTRFSWDGDEVVISG
ncbi:MAG: CapA family protein [Chloroflexi bacterium]|nr:CapA family protein [Chloroflexota bacterium]